jgi:hypothetical protein
MPTRLCFALLAAAAVIGGAGCNLDSGSGSDAQVEVTRQVQRGVTPEERTLAFDSYSGGVTLQDTTASQAELTFVKRARAGSKKEARRLLSRIRIEGRGDDQEFAYELTSGAPGRTSVDVRGHAPQNVRLRLHMQNGDALLSGLRGPLDVKNENGDIRIGGAARAVRAETRNGSIEGGLRRLPSGAEVRLRTANGDLQLTLPASASADIEARTEAGDIDPGALTFSDRDLESSGAGARFEGTLGEGAAPVRLRTENGDITLRRGTVRRLPGVEGDTTARDTTRRDTLSSDTTRRDTAGLPGPPRAGPQQRPQQQPRPQQQTAPYTDQPPRLLRAPDQNRSGRDTNAGPSPVPSLPSPRADTARRQQ